MCMMHTFNLHFFSGTFCAFLAMSESFWIFINAYINMAYNLRTNPEEAAAALQAMQQQAESQQESTLGLDDEFQ